MAENGVSGVVVVISRDANGNIRLQASEHPGRVLEHINAAAEAVRMRIAIDLVKAELQGESAIKIVPAGSLP